jgi:hypothetical protein
LFEQLEDRLLLVSDWQNPRLAADVDDNGFVSAPDAIAVISDLRRNMMQFGQADRELPPVTATVHPPPFLDVVGGNADEGDNRVTAADAIAIIAILRADTLPPVIVSALANDTAPDGAVDDDRLTFDPTISGVVTDSTVGMFVPSGVASLTAKVDGGPFVLVLINPLGEFRFDPGFFQNGTSDGDHVVQFQARDGRGNISSIVDVPFTLDTTAPTTPPAC